jgi:hypothetical protein
MGGMFPMGCLPAPTLAASVDVTSTVGGFEPSVGATRRGASHRPLLARGRGNGHDRSANDSRSCTSGFPLPRE